MTEAKKLVTYLLADIYGKVRVHKGRGTARSWLKISTDHAVPESVRHLVEKHLVNKGHCGSFYSDWDEYVPNVNWSLNWKTWEV